MWSVICIEFMLEPEAALEAWKKAGSPKAPRDFLDRTTVVE